MLYTTWLDVSYSSDFEIAVSDDKKYECYTIEVATATSDQRVNIVLSPQQLRGLIASAQHALDDAELAKVSA